ncbi:hypothetical protein [Nonomuraea sp. NPDC003709]|uniref:hypothetical protein n=1 Tax=Nonomuraea sp. NPDC003709 TaxID=3154450 RepID=UPI0033AEE00A
MGSLEPSPARERTGPKPPQHLGVSPTIGRRAMPDSLLTVPAGARVPELDRLRCGPVRVSGPEMTRALERATETAALNVG